MISEQSVTKKLDQYTLISSLIKINLQPYSLHFQSLKHQTTDVRYSKLVQNRTILVLNATIFQYQRRKVGKNSLNIILPLLYMVAILTIFFRYSSRNTHSIILYIINCLHQCYSRLCIKQLNKTDWLIKWRLL